MFLMPFDLPQPDRRAIRPGAVALHWVAAVVISPAAARATAKRAAILTAGLWALPSQLHVVVGASEIEMNAADVGVGKVIVTETGNDTGIGRGQHPEQRPAEAEEAREQGYFQAPAAHKLPACYVHHDNFSLLVQLENPPLAPFAQALDCFSLLSGLKLLLAFLMFRRQAGVSPAPVVQQAGDESDGQEDA